VHYRTVGYMEKTRACQQQAVKIVRFRPLRSYISTSEVAEAHNWIIAGVTMVSPGGVDEHPTSTHKTIVEKRNLQDVNCGIPFSPTLVLRARTTKELKLSAQMITSEIEGCR
jgi:hypothetical protein